jgi:hypothetical protein
MHQIIIVQVAVMSEFMKGVWQETTLKSNRNSGHTVLTSSMLTGHTMLTLQTGRLGAAAEGDR